MRLTEGVVGTAELVGALAVHENDASAAAVSLLATEAVKERCFHLEVRLRAQDALVEAVLGPYPTGRGAVREAGEQEGLGAGGGRSRGLRSAESKVRGLGSVATCVKKEEWCGSVR